MKSALVIIDMQSELLAGEGAVAQADELVRIVGGLLERARAGGVPVVFVQDDEVAGGAGEGWQIHPALAPRPGETVVHKLACDAFHETVLDAELRAKGIERLVIAGVKTEYCIDTTCRRATSMGYWVGLVADGHSTSSTPVLDASAVIRHHNRLLHEFGAVVDGRECGIYVHAAAETQL